MKYFVNIVVSKIVDAETRDMAKLIAKETVKAALDKSGEEVERCEAVNVYVP